MDNTNNLMLNAFMEAVNAHIDARVEARLKNINEAAITEYVQRAINAKFAEVNTSMQIMSTLDTQLELKITAMIDTAVGAAMATHLEDWAHNDDDGVESIVRNMDRMKSDSVLEQRMYEYLTDNNYTTESNVEGMLETITEGIEFADAVKTVMNDASISVTFN